MPDEGWLSKDGRSAAIQLNLCFVVAIRNKQYGIQMKTVNVKLSSLLTTMSALMLMAVTLPASSRDDVLTMPIDQALARKSEMKTPYDESIKIFFGEQAYPTPTSTVGEYTTNKKTNGVGKSDSSACQWAFLSALAELQDRAKREGGNAVVGVESYYKKIEFKSATEYHCGAGSVVSGVALKGTVVRLP